MLKLVGVLSRSRPRNSPASRTLFSPSSRAGRENKLTLRSIRWARIDLGD
jgi:hypothetical protein